MSRPDLLVFDLKATKKKLQTFIETFNPKRCGLFGQLRRLILWPQEVLEVTEVKMKKKK